MIKNEKFYSAIQRLKSHPIIKPIAVGASALLIASTLTACGGKLDDKLRNYNVSELLELDQAKFTTQIDDEVEEEKETNKFETYVPGNNDTMYNNNMNIVEAATKLEEAMRFVSAFDYRLEVQHIDINEVELLDSLTKEEKEEILSSTDIYRLLDDVGDVTSDVSEKSLEALYYQYKKDLKFIQNKGTDIAEKLMITAVEGSIANETSLDISDIEVPEYRKEFKDGEYCIDIDGKEYKVEEKSEISNAIKLIYELQGNNASGKWSSYTDITNECEEALSMAKRIIVKGSNLENGIIKDQNKDDYVKELISKKK